MMQVMPIMSNPEPISVHDDAAAFRTSVSNMKMAVFLLRASIQQSKPDQGWPQRAQFYLLGGSGGL